MILADITKNILKDIVWRIYPDLANEDDRNSFISTIDSSIEDAYDDLMDPMVEPLLKPAYKHILSAIHYYSSMPGYFDSAVVPNPPYFLYTVNDTEDVSYLLNINTSTSPYILTSTSFWHNNTIAFEDLSSNTDLWDAIIRIWQHIQPNSLEALEFWNQLTAIQTKNYYLAVDGENIRIADKEKAWKYYAYGYFSIINSSKFPIPDKLKIHNPNNPLKELLSYVPQAKYDQFFDTYNVLNEVKHAEDKLTKYLKTYHVVEQFAYRAKFIKLVNAKQNKDISLVRRLEALTDTFKQSETETIVSSIDTLFPNLQLSLNGQIGSPEDVLTNQCRKFLQEKYNINEEVGTRTYSAKSVGLMVYNLRNSIVHNKETEFHLTYNNVSEYECVIPLLEYLSNKLIDGIIHLIENNRCNKVLYRRKTLKLY